MKTKTDAKACEKCGVTMIAGREHKTGCPNLKSEGHTKGTWTLDDSDGRIKIEGGMTIATINNHRGGILPGLPNGAANARLIAAAPDLLAAAQAVVDFFQHTDARDMSTPQYQMREKALAAIQKAGGR
jgi:hypothetical protein